MAGGTRKRLNNGEGGDVRGDQRGARKKPKMVETVSAGKMEDADQDMIRKAFENARKILMQTAALDGDQHGGSNANQGNDLEGLRPDNAPRENATENKTNTPAPSKKRQRTGQDASSHEGLPSQKQPKKLLSKTRQAVGKGIIRTDGQRVSKPGKSKSAPPLASKKDVLGESEDEGKEPVKAVKKSPGGKKKKAPGGPNRLLRVPPLPADGASAAELAAWFWEAYSSNFKNSISPLEDQPIPESSMAVLQRAAGEDPVATLATHVKALFGPDWRSSLCGGSAPSVPGGHGHKQQAEGQATDDAEGPALLIICSSAKRCTDMLRGVRPLGRGCRTAKLFAKHIKVQEQMSALQASPVHVAAGTPNRLNQLVGAGALSVSGLQVLLLDLQRMAKGLTLLDVPELRVDFWEFYRKHLHQRVLEGNCRICIY
eukprot:jgi/Mesen1/9977/ME000072S09388